MNYKQTIDSLYNLMPDFSDTTDAYKPGLERIREFLRYLGNPQQSFDTVHVAGTNGKGSVSHMLASMLASAGYRTGLHTSPHLKDFRERIRVDGEMIPEGEVVAFAEKHMDEIRRIGLSFFEVAVGMAFDWFARQDVEVAVVETGLGGRLDATNIVTPLVSVVTNIGMDHMALLGDTLEKIAAEKAGIIKRGVPVVIGERDQRTAPVFEEAAERLKAPIVFAQDFFAVAASFCEGDKQIFAMEKPGQNDPFRLETDLLGRYQERNVVTALAAVKTLNEKSPITVSRRAIAEGMAQAASSTGLKGRWEIHGRGPLVVSDTGHNAHGLAEVVRQIAEQDYDKLYMVLGMVRDKDLEHVLPLLPKQAHYIFTQPSVGRALPAAEFAAAAAKTGLAGEVVPDVRRAVARARALAGERDMIFVGGSNFTVAEMD